MLTPLTGKSVDNAVSEFIACGCMPGRGGVSAVGRARWSAKRHSPAYAGPQRRTVKSAATGQSVSPSELPRLPRQGHFLQNGGSALGGPFVEEIRNCVGKGHVGQA